ncbi:MAG TPA: antibiotic biosynthesis monooxygenase family protein [Phytomonospora sp.]
MTTIAADSPVVTLINVFTVEPDRQEELVEALETATTGLMRTIDGFVSANIHASLDGVRVTNYAQWESEAHFEAMLADPQVREHLAATREIATSFEPHLYRVRSVHTGA